MHRGIVLYTDGGTHSSNPGPIGYGIHGYSYTTEKPTKSLGLSNILPTQYGYRNKKEESIEYKDITLEELNSDTAYLVDIKEIINVYGTDSGDKTNNVAEMKAMLFALEYIYKHKDEYDKFVIYSDSNYVVKGLNEYIDTWEKNQYSKSNGEIISNKELWIALKEAKDKLSNLPYSIYWIKGHDNDIGNTMADLLATIGANKSYQGNKGYLSNPEEMISITTNDFFIDDSEIHPLLSAKRFYFNPLRDKSDGKYYLGELGDKREDEEIGKEISDAGLSIVYLKNNDTVMEMIKSSQKEWLDRHNYNKDCIVAGMLDIISMKSRYNDFLRYNDLIIKSPVRIRPDLFLLGDKDIPLTVVLDPPYLSMRLLDQFTILEEKVEAIRNNIYNDIIIDITDRFYQDKMDKKNTVIGRELRPDMTNTVKSIDVSFTDKEKEITLTLTLGIDLPNRNTLKRLEKFNPIVSLLIWKVDNSLYNYACVIHTDNDEWGIWKSSYSNNHLV